MKSIISIIIFGLAMSAFAKEEVVCTFKTGTGASVTSIVTVKHQIKNNVHAVTNFSTDRLEGYIAVANGYLVVNTVDQETNQIISFYGWIEDEKVVGGNQFSQDNEFWTQIYCK